MRCSERFSLACLHVGDCPKYNKFSNLSAACMSSLWVNASLAPPSHWQDDSLIFLLRYALPFLSEFTLQLIHISWLGLACTHSTSKFVPMMLYRSKIHREQWPVHNIHMIDAQKVCSKPSCMWSQVIMLEKRRWEDNVAWTVGQRGVGSHRDTSEHLQLDWEQPSLFDD